MQGSRGRQHQEQRRPAGLKASNQGGSSGEPVPSLRAVAVLSFSKKDFTRVVHQETRSLAKYFRTNPPA